ncbi:MAG: hypothetical protein HYY18_18635 [Planctomycetes bacterium]|nr:hypothetical protein [Planctomycetota bacterium]
MFDNNVRFSADAGGATVTEPVFLFEERRAFIRTRTHLVITNRQPGFFEFAATGDGVVARLVRVWVGRIEGRETIPSAYLGSVVLCPSSTLGPQVARLLRRASASLAGRSEFPRATLHRLVLLLRRFAAA